MLAPKIRNLNLLLVCFVSGLAVATARQQELPIVRFTGEKCELAIAWTGEIKADLTGSSFESWLAQPEIMDGFRAIRKLIDENSERAEPQAIRIANQMFDLALQKPWVLSLDEFDPAALKVKFAAQLGPQAAALEKSLQELEAQNPEKFTQFEINGAKFTSTSPDGLPTVEYGFFEDHLVVATGAGELQVLLARAKANTPAWVTELRNELPIERLAGLVRVDFRRLTQLLKDSDEADVPPELHLEEFEEIVGVFGFDGRESITRIALHCPPHLKGVLKSWDVSPMNLTDLATVPDGIDSMFAAKFNPQQLWQILATNEQSKSDVEEFAETLSQDYGIDFERDVLGSFGEYVYSYQQLSLVNPASSGILALRVKDPENFSVRLAEIVESLADDNENFSIDSEDNKNGTLYTIVPNGEPQGIPIPTPSFQLVDDQLIFALDSKAISSHLRKANRTTGKITDDVRVAALFDKEKNGGLGQPIGIQYLEVNTLVEVFYSVIPMLAAGPMADAGFNMEDLPPLDVVTNGVEPDIIGVYRTPAGFQFLEKTTLPGLTTATPVMIGLLLPAVQQARNAARRAASTNNVRQLLLANHNWESSFRTFPPAYTKDAEGQKLLSWRVHVLPFMEENELYEKFRLDEPWDSPHNKALIAEMPATFVHPELKLAPGQTVYLGVTGTAAAFMPPATPAEKNAITTGMNMAQITDGTSNTLLIVEVNADHAVTWTQPADLNVDEIEDLVGALTGNWPGRQIMLGFCDGSVQMLQEPTNEQLKKMATVNGGEVIDR